MHIGDLHPRRPTKRGVDVRVAKGQVQKGLPGIAKKKVAAERPVAAAKTAAKPSCATKAKAGASNGKERRKEAHKSVAVAKSKVPDKGKTTTIGRPPAEGKAKKTTRGIQKKAPAAKVTLSKKPVAQMATAALGLRRNTRLQTRGKEQVGGLGPKSRTTGAPVGAKKPSPAAAIGSGAFAKRPGPAQSAMPPTASAAAAVGTKRKAQGDSDPPASKHANNAPLSHSHCSASAPNAAAPAAKAKSLPNALPSLGGTAASAAASGKPSQVCPRQDKGKAPIVQRDNAPAGGSRGTQEAVAGVCSKPAYGSGSASKRAKSAPASPDNRLATNEGEVRTQKVPEAVQMNDDDDLLFVLAETTNSLHHTCFIFLLSLEGVPKRLYSGRRDRRKIKHV
jgi:hypothetical protein